MQRKRQHGLSLIELMVAIAIGLILSLGAIQIFVSNKRAYRDNTDVSLMQDNARAATETVARSVRMSGHWGGVAADDVSGSPSITGIGGCDGAWIFDVATPIRGYEGAATASAISDFPSNCLSDGDYVPYSDILVLRYADGDFVDNASLSSSTLYLRSQASNRAEFFQGPSSNIPADLQDAPGTEFTTGRYSYPYVIDIYFLRPCTNKTGTTCSASDDSGKPLPSLTRFSLDGTVLKQQPLIDGIEQLQFEYGVDVDGDGNADTYVDSTTLDANGLGWTNVRGVRINILARSINGSSGYTDTKTYTMAGYSYTVPTTTAHHIHKLNTLTSHTRNLSTQD